MIYLMTAFVNCLLQTNTLLSLQVSWKCDALLVAINPYLTNGFSHPYHLGDSTSSFRGSRSDFIFVSFFR